MLSRSIYIPVCAVLAQCLMLFAGCGADETTHGGWSVEKGDGSQTEYGSDTTTVTTPGASDSNVIVTGDPDQCVDVEETCVDLEQAKEQGGQYCDDPNAQADVIIADGEVVEVICYPPKDDGTDIREADTDEEGNAEVPQTESGSVVTFNQKTDGEPIVGDINIDAERTTLFGNGPDKTIIDGKITVQSNHARIRGMTVSGNVEFGINSNNSAISFCRIQGDLNVKANQFTAANCVVFGKVQITGNGATLVNIGVQGDWQVPGSADCRGCYSFVDENQDFLVQDEEVGEQRICGPADPST